MPVQVKGDLYALHQAFPFRRPTMQVIRQNMWFTFLYSGLSIPLAADILYPFTSVAMSLSSLSVILNSLRLRRFK